MLPIYESLPYCNPRTLFAGVSAYPGALLLDGVVGTDAEKEGGRYSYICIAPVVVFSGDELAWQQAVAVLAEYSYDVCEGLPPFQGGLAGVVPYEFGHALLPSSDKTKHFSLGVYDVVCSFDHVSKSAWIVSTGYPAQHEGERLVQAENRLRELKDMLLSACPSSDKNNVLPPESIRSNFDANGYQQMVSTATAHILAGDIFEVNVSQQFSVQLPKDFSPFALYQRVNEISPAPYSAFYQAGDLQIASVSPECFFTVLKRIVTTYPIKGTSARGETPEEDSRLADALLCSKKDRAENIMIVDLMRNDLSRVCLPKSVRVRALCALHTFAQVHHLVSTVEGVLKPGLGPLDVLVSAFPAGSVTGAPKVRAMEIIDKLEGVSRQAYCGSLGFVGFNGEASFSVLIRSYMISNKQITFQAGGAVVLDSEPEQEYQESLTKAAALIAALVDK